MGQGHPDSRSFKRFKTTVFSQVFAQQIFYVRLSVNNPRQATWPVVEWSQTLHQLQVD